MYDCREERYAVWLYGYLWGLDAPAAALLWCGLCAPFMHVTMLDPGSLLLLAVSVWVYVMWSRLRDAIVRGRGRYAAFYRSHAAGVSLLILCASLAALWMLFFYVGQGLIAYAALTGIWLVLGAVCSRFPLLRIFCRAAAFVTACLAPIAYFSMDMGPVSVLFCRPFSFLTLLFFLFGLVQTDDEIRPYVLPQGMLCLLLLCIFAIFRQPAYERGLYESIILGLACVHFLRYRLMPRNRMTADAAAWVLMALAALLGRMMFLPQ